MSKINKHSLKCPECHESILDIDNTKIEVPDEQKPYWINDGDCLPFSDMVTNEDFEHYLKRGSVSLLVGNCNHCKEDYFVIEICLCGNEIDKDSDFYYDNILNEPEQEAEKIYLMQDREVELSYIVEDWIRREYIVDENIIHIDSILLNTVDYDAKAENGMCACIASGGVWEKSARFVSLNFNKIIKNRIFE